jgi:GNAT superfamily N-acetyltransferase
MTIELLPLTSRSRHFDEVVLIYTDFSQRDPEDSAYNFRTYMQYPDYVGLIAVIDRRAVGFAFGTRSQMGQWWHDRVAVEVGARHPALRGAWVLTELHVAAPFRSKQIGTALHDAIIARQPFRNLLLSTPMDNDRGQRFYLRHGWDYLHRGFAFVPGDLPYAVMSKRVKA